LKLPHINFSLARFLNQTVVTLLLGRWGIDFLQRGVDPQSSAVTPLMQKRLVPFLQWLRLLVVGYLGLVWVAGSGGQLVWLVRLILEAALLIRVGVFWRVQLSVVAQELQAREGRSPRRRLLLTAGLSYLVAGGALLMDLTGYRALAGHWLVSWALTMVLGLWAYLVWHVIQEWYTAQKAVPAGDKEAGLPTVAAPVGWFMVQMARLVWLGALLTGALLIWSSRDVTTATLAEVFNLAFAVGSLSFSVKGLLLAVIILCATHVASRIGRRLLREKVLSGRDFERGLKDSIVTITSYVMWGLGLVLALGVLGVNATSLAVVFGALSIGIGFGLQNIFNNFISGLILLFERPIQVGDYVEVGGVWAEVKQINVRSTIVHTFDNAAVIIPNSEFISQQVTNWSFKDPRMRRQVDVGVAYGSDIELVRDTLLDIAAQIPQILHFPKPDVIFLDHGDSALIFRLRFWTHVDNYYSTTTAVRFELDRRFRELGIEIAFPQRDLHIRSAPENLFTTGPALAAAASTPQKPPSDTSQTDS
jgi:small-conductance mechanosensitive channel